MRLNSGEAVETDSLGDIKVIKGGISEQSIHLLVDMLSNQMYSNPIGSIVREITSNCFDAHAELEKVTGVPVEDAVIVRYSEEEGLGFISFIDFGIGMNPERVESVYLKLLESSKRDTDDLIGGFGVGGKSFLSYTDSINLTTRSDGTEYFYIVGKDEQGEFGAYLMDTRPTTEKNGSEIKMAIGRVPYFEKAADYYKFRKEIQKQLYYFDNVYVDGFELDNEYQLFEGSHFKFRTGWDSPFTEMHLTLGKVVYPINWKTLEREPINLPIAIKFDIGELSVTINREELRYIGATKEIINNRIDTAIEEIKRLYNKQVTEVNTLEEYFEAVNSERKYLIFKGLNGEPHDLILPSKVGFNQKGEKIIEDVIPGLLNPNCKAFSHLPITIPKDPFFPFLIKGFIAETFPKKDSRIEELEEKYTKNTFKAVTRLSESVYRLKGERTRTLDKFLEWKQRQDNKHNPVLLSIRKLSYKLWCEYLGLGKEVKRDVNKIVYYRDYLTIPDEDTGEEVRVAVKTWKFEPKRIQINEPTDLSVLNKAKIIKEYKKLITKELVERTQSYDNQVLSSQYLAHLELQKVSNRRPKLQGFISINNILTGVSSDTLDLSTLNDFKGYIIYGERTQAKEVRNIMTLLRAAGRRHKNGKKEKFIHKFFVTGKNNFSPLLSNSYFMSVEEFMSGHNRLFKNAVTAWYVKSKLDNIKSVGGRNLYSNIKLFNIDLYNKIKALTDWTYEEIAYENLDEDFMNLCFAVGKENRLLHEDKIQEVDKIAEWFKGLSHLRFIEQSGWNNSEIQKDLVLILKSRGKRLGNEHYLQKPTTIPVIVEAEQLELELPEILIDEEIEIENEEDYEGSDDSYPEEFLSQDL